MSQILQWHPAFQAAMQIGRIFKRYNILEYKSPEKSHTVNSFFKVVSYAGLLQSNTQREQEIPPEEITITLIGDRYPRRLLAYLKRRHRIGIEQAYPGIYYVDGLLFPMQVIVQRELDKGENVWLSRLRQNPRNSLDGGQEGAKSGVKLACKQGFAPSCTSDGHPMLLVRPIGRARRCSPSKWLRICRCGRMWRHWPGRIRGKMEIPCTVQ